MSDNAERQRRAGFEAAARAAQRRPEASGRTAFDKAEQQRDRQEAAAARAALRRQQQEERMFRQHAAAEARRQREADRITREEIRHRERVLRAEERRSGLSDRLARIDRLGRAGSTAAERGQFGELRRIERTLERIQHIEADSARFQKDPAAQARVQRVKEQIAGARSAIATGFEVGGVGPMRRTVGRAGAAALDFFKDPAFRTARDIALATTAAPWVMGKFVQGVVGMARPYLDFRIAEAQIARAGQFDRNALDAMIMPAGAFNSAVPGAGQSAAMRALGLSPHAVLRNIQNTGIAPRSAAEAFTLAGSVRSAYMAPGIGLDESVLARLLGNAMTSGAVRGGTPRALDLSAQKYFSELQRVTTTATSLGVDRSRLTNTFASLMASTRTGIPNASSAADLIARLSGSGAPNMRNGTGVLSLTQGAQESAGQLGAGGDVIGNIGVMSYFQRHGNMPTTEAGLQKAMGVTKEQWRAITGTAAGQKLLQGYLSAIGQGDKAGALQYFGELVKGSGPLALPIMERIYKGSIYGESFANNPDLYMRGEKRFLHAELGDVAALNSTTPGQGRGPSGAAAVPSSAMMQAAQKASAETGVPVSTILAISSAESNNDLRARSSAGALGPFQIMPSTMTQYTDPETGQRYKPEDAFNPEKAARVAALEFKKNQEAARKAGVPEQQVDAVSMGAYNAGRGRIPQIMRGQMADETRSDIQRFTSAQIQYGNMAIPEQRTLATGDVAGLKAAEYISNSVDVVVKGFDMAAGAATRFAAAADHAAQQLGKGHTGIPFSVAPGAGSLPHSTAPMRP